MQLLAAFPRWHWSTWLVVVTTAIVYTVAWPTLFLTHQVPAPVAPLVAALAACPLLLVRFNPLLGWALSAVAAVAIPLFFDRVAPYDYPWQVVHLIELLVLIVGVTLTRPLPVVAAVWAASTVLFAVAMPDQHGSGWAFGVTTMVAMALLVRSLMLSRRELARQEEVSDLERARRTVLEERTRIARDLHDVVAHHMSMVVVSAQTAPYRHPDVPSHLHTEFEAIAATGRHALNEIRGLLGVLRSDGDLAELAPAPRLSDLPELFTSTQRAGVAVCWRVDGSDALVGDLVGAAAYRIVQECLANAARHAPGSPVIVEVKVTADGVAIEVRNRLTAAGLFPAPSGLGIPGMRERVGAFGGTLAVHERDGEFVVWSYLPYLPVPVLVG